MPLPSLVERAKRGAGTLGRDQEDVEVGARLDEAEADREAVAEAERCAFAQVRLDLAIERGVDLVGREHHDDVGRRDGVFEQSGLQPGGFGFERASGAAAQARRPRRSRCP